MWLWRSWMPAPWKCSCAVCSRGKATARASAGSPSILTDVWTVKIKEFYFSGLILFTASSWTFLIEQGKLSTTMSGVEKPRVSVSSLFSQWWHVLFTLSGGHAAPCAGAGQHPRTWKLAGFAGKSCVPSWGTWTEKHVSPLRLISKESNSIF